MTDCRVITEETVKETKYIFSLSFFSLSLSLSHTHTHTIFLSYNKTTFNTYILKEILSHANAHTHTRTQTHTHAHTHTRMHTHTMTHIHSLTHIKKRKGLKFCTLQVVSNENTVSMAVKGLNIVVLNRRKKNNNQNQI